MPSMDGILSTAHLDGWFTPAQQADDKADNSQHNKDQK